MSLKQRFWLFKRGSVFYLQDSETGKKENLITRDAKQADRLRNARNEDGVCFVLRAGDKFELLHTNRLADDDMCMATPALAGDRLLIRTAAWVYLMQSATRSSAGTRP